LQNPAIVHYDPRMQCVIPGCQAWDATSYLAVRLRKQDTNAVFAPNSEACICDAHAVSGMKITVVAEATDTRNVEVTINGSTRVTPIIQDA
jgi:hypothetical protein